MNRSLLPSVKVTVGTIAAGAASAIFHEVDWEALIVAVVVLVLSYLFPELNPSPSAIAKATGTKP